MSRKVLITGTTSGLGRSLMEQYIELGWEVIAVNRRQPTEMENQVLNVRYMQTNIHDEHSVLALCRELEEKNLKPDILILNAGINRIDNSQQLEINQFKEVLNTNLYGNLNFIHAAQMLGWSATIVGISSTSTIVSNTNNLGYLVSKVSINNIFKYLSMVDKKRCYKVVILGPVVTNLNHALPSQLGLQKIIFDFLSLPPHKQQ